MLQLSNSTSFTVILIFKYVISVYAVVFNFIAHCLFDHD